MSDLTKLAEPVAWRWRDPVDNTVGEWRSMPVVPIKIEPGETGFEYDYAYLSPPNLAAELAEAQRLIEFWRKSSGEWRDGYVRLQKDLAEVKKERDGMRTSADELRRAVADLINADPETWPDHGNAPLAIAASLAIERARAEKAEAVLAEERESCAALCDRFFERGMNAAECAAAIRGAKE